MAWQSEMDIEELLLKYELISAEQAAAIRLEAINTGCSFRDLVLEKGTVSEDAMLYAISVELGLPFVTLEPGMIDKSVALAAPREIMEKYLFIPMVEVDDEIRVAVSDPADPVTRSALADTFGGKAVGLSVALPSNVKQMIASVFAEEEAVSGVQQAQTTAIGTLYSSLADAVTKGASTLYFEPVGKIMRIRKRIKNRLIECAAEPVEALPSIIEKIKTMVNIASGTSGSIKTAIAGRQVFVTARILSGGEVSGAVIQFRYPEKTVPLEGFGLAEDQRAAIGAVLQAGRGLILITGSDRELRESLAHSLIMECNPQRRKVVALFIEENMIAGLESYVTVSAGETNRAVAELRGVSADAVYIEDIRREGLQLGGLLQLAETTTVIASISVPAAKEAVAFIERRTPELAPSDRGLLMVVETLKNEIPCAACSPATLGVRGKGCRKCGYAGFTGHLQKINCISY